MRTEDEQEEYIMVGKIFAVVGNWGFAPAPKGITTYEYIPETGDLKMIETVRPEIAAGQLCIDQERGIVYACDERGERRGEIGGGGYLLAFRLDPQTGKLTFINERESLCPEPSYICMDKSRKYLLVSHCSDPGHVTKIRKNEDGTFSNEVQFDDTGLSVFRIREDGGIGEMCDLSITKGNESIKAGGEVSVDPMSGHIQLVKVISRLHCVVPSMDGEVYLTCDKGMDCIYTYQLNRETGKLNRLDQFETGHKVFPRYAASHPTLPVFYVNHEFVPVLDALQYDKETGKVKKIFEVPLLFEDPGLIDGRPAGAQDILVSPDGKTLYCSLFGINSISVMSLKEDGEPVLKQTIPCGGKMPRGLQISPDGKYLFSGNMLSGDITAFGIMEDGTLKDLQKNYEAVSPSAIRFYIP